eukprot:957952-Prorocentrum_minimum.AAC.1
MMREQGGLLRGHQGATRDHPRVRPPQRLPRALQHKRHGEHTSHHWLTMQVYTPAPHTIGLRCKYIPLPLTPLAYDASIYPAPHTVGLQC